MRTPADSGRDFFFLAASGRRRKSKDAIVDMAVLSLYNVIDSMFIGHGARPPALATLAVCSPVMNLIRPCVC